MVGFISKPSIDDLDQAPRLKNSSNSLDSFDTKSAEFSFSDSFLDFDSIEDWFEDITIPDMDDIGKAEYGATEKPTELVQQQIPHESKPTSNASKLNVDGSEPVVRGSEPTVVCGFEPTGNALKLNVDGSEPVVRGCEPTVGRSGCAVKVEEGECEKLRNLSCCIEQEMGKVTLVGESVNSRIGNGNDVKSEIESDGDESGSSESKSESSSSSSSTAASSSGSSDDDEEEEEEEEKKEVEVEVKRSADEAGEVEEGEIRDVDEQEMVGGTNDDDGEEEEEEEEENNEDDGVVMVGWSDVDEDGDEDGGGAAKGPIRSANELEVLPPVPPVDVTLQLHHQMLPVGVVLSIIGAQVIVEGVEKHNPLSEGSILWITESRSPLGLVDEIFGPVKNPYYKVRYNSESEVPSGIHAGSSISFVQEFAHHVLNDKDLYKRGYDASGANDEEMSDEAEFSDDEREAEYRRMQKMTKRGLDGQKARNKKNNGKGVKNRDGPWRNAQPSSRPQQIGAGQPPPTQNQHNFSPAAGFLNQGHCSSSSALGQGFVGGTGIVPPFPSAPQAIGFNASNGVWTNGMPFQPPQNGFFPNGFPTNSMPWLSQNPHMHQMPMPNRMPFQQQFDPSQMPPHAALLPTYAPGLVAQNAFNQRTFGMGLQGQFTHPSMKVGEQGILSNGLQVEQNLNMQQSGFSPGNVEAPQQINRGASYSRGRKPYRRGGGRFAGGRRWQQSK